MHKALVLVALILCCLSVSLDAQGKIYNPGNSPSTGSNNSWPFNVHTAWRFQFIVNASVLPNAPIKITDIAFAPSATTTWGSNQFQVRMGHTTKSNFNTPVPPNCFDDMLGPCPTICYNGPIKWACTADTWSPLRLQCPFGYDGKRNILVEIRYNGRTTSGVTTHTDPSINRAYTHTGYVADPFNELCWQTPIPGQAAGPKHCISYDRTCILLASDTVPVGNTAGISIIQGPGGAFYQIAASLGQSGFFIKNCHLCLSVDSVFFASIFVGPPVFNGYSGTLTASGSGSAKFACPNFPPLAGLCIYHAALLFDNSSILCCTNTDGTLIVP